ncbi:MAG: glucose-1-phosphate adenylyltransferase [Planctomycetota bacterium]|nr:MAG: glucose-1-phosphate adenylyltransferase [Planctomycetota bacterium]
MRDVVTLLLAGGKGERLMPLTRDRAKPAVPFGGCYRIVDFTLSNCVNSGLRRILVLTQYKAASLDRHLNLAWRFLCRELDEFIDILPPQQRIGEQWYSGTANAVYQNIYSIEKAQSKYVLILSGDHIYKMDYSEMLRDHFESGADLTIGCLPVELRDGRQFGVMQIDSNRRIVNFREKPADPDPIPGDPTRCLASMGIYVFNTKFLFEQLCNDATNQNSAHDFGKNIIPSVVPTHRVRAFPFRDRDTNQAQYWRDVGTLEAYFEANMDLIAVQPPFNLYDNSWPIRTFHSTLPPPKFVFADLHENAPRAGFALDSLISQGCIVSGGRVERSILSPNVRINSWADVRESILLSNVTIGRHARIRRAIIDKGVQVPEEMEIGFDHDVDRQRGFTVTDSGLVVIAKSDGTSQLADLD